MITVDTHCHVGLNWFEPVESLLFQMDSNGVDKAVLIQHRGSYDNSYILDCVTRFPARFVAIVLVDSVKQESLNQLEEAVKLGATGVRLEPGDSNLIWEKAAQMDLVVSCQGEVTEFGTDIFRDKIKELPSLKIVLEHLGGVNKNEPYPYNSFAKMVKLADLENVYLKVPGLGEIASRPRILEKDFQLKDVPPFIEMSIEAFGTNHLMWGSDFPAVSNREGYRNAKETIANHKALKSDFDVASVMGRTALDVFKFV